jgi:Protein of unknown function (DUF2911)
MNRFIPILLVALVACNSKKEATTSETKSDSTNTKPKPALVIIQKQSEPDTLKGSLEAKATGKVGEAEIKIHYHSPAVRGRIIWGGLVPYDKVWVTGAHSATSVEFSKDVIIGSTTVAAGKYALFTIPGKDEWTIIINKNWEQHLTDDYDEKLDVVRVKVKPEMEESNQERLRYEFEEKNGKGEIVVYWEKLEVSLEFKVK